MRSPITAMEARASSAKGGGMSERWIAKYRCLKCGFEWSEPAGPTQCPKCGHLYVRWLNYERLRRQ